MKKKKKKKFSFLFLFLYIFFIVTLISSQTWEICEDNAGQQINLTTSTWNLLSADFVISVQFQCILWQLNLQFRPHTSMMHVNKALLAECFFLIRCCLILHIKQTDRDHTQSGSYSLISFLVPTVGSNGEQGPNLELEADPTRDLREAGPHEETPGVHTLQRSAERSQRSGAHGRHDGGGYSETHHNIRHKETSG